MLKPNHRLAIYMEGAFEEASGKMGLGVIRYSKNPIVAIVDSRSVGKSSRELTGMDVSIPVVGSLAEATAFKPDVLILGIAPSGGRIPPTWQPVIDEAIASGLSIVNGLHDMVTVRSELKPGQFVWEVRREPEGLAPGTGEARLLKNRRILTIGTDMAIGKMTAGLELTAALTRRGKNVAFVATGQIGMVITGGGAPLDAIRLDFAPGSIEREVLRHAGADYVVIEGQGSLLHPGSSANLPLIRGSVPTDLVLCHRAGMDYLQRSPWVKVPPLNEVVEMYQDLAEIGGNLPRPKMLGICLNTSELSATDAEAVMAQLASETGFVVCDPVRFGIDPIVEALIG